MKVRINDSIVRELSFFYIINIILKIRWCKIVSVNKVLKIITSRIFLTVALILLQVVLVSVAVVQLSIDSRLIVHFIGLLTILLLLRVVNQNNIDSGYKIAWILVLTCIPLVGPVLYLIFANRKVPKSYRLNTDETIASYRQKIGDTSKVLETYSDHHHLYNFQKYVTEELGNGTFSNTKCKYFGYGEEMFEQWFDDLQQAKHFILLEYYIIAKGHIWSRLVPLLKEKLAQGVRVILIYDDFGTITTMNRHFTKQLESLGLETVCFNPIKPTLVGTMNYRNHRKLTVIDNKIGYMGGINLADEYANLKVRYGRWKDSAIRIEGEAVWGYTVIFLHLYSKLSGKQIDFDWFKQFGCSIENTGIVTPFADSPNDDDETGLLAHINMLNDAKDYVYICAPYLLLNDTLLKTIMYTAKRGVDVRIITPHVPDKFYVHWVSQSFYQRLVESGVKIYEYTPGFIHAKTWVSDDIVGIVGTSNIDYRSYYLNFECNTIVSDNEFALSLRKDFEQTLTISQPITLKMCQEVPFIKRLVGAICAVFSPLF